jgi:methionyl aminopeptidase
VAATTRDAVVVAARPGVSTLELDLLAAELLRRAGAKSAPQQEYGFPGWLCLSVNDVIVHGIPGEKRLRPGDLLKVDVTIERGGYVVDTARTVAIPPITEVGRRLIRCAREAFRRALAVLAPARPLRAVGQAVSRAVANHRLHVVPDLTGHGVGRRIHEWPPVPNVDTAAADFHPWNGLVLAVEPLVSATASQVVEDPDGWTLRTSTGAWTSHHEHTVVVRSGAPLVLTQ